MLFRCLSTLLATLFCSILWAADKESVAIGVTRSPVSKSTLIEAVVGLVVVIGLILVLGWGVKKLIRMPLSGKGSISVLGGVSLGHREKAVLLQVGETQLLVGVAPGRVQTLHVLTDPIIEPETDPESDGFREKFKNALTDTGDSK